MSKYVIGIDYGTLSGRASLVDTADGRVLASAVYDYPHAVMDTALPCGVRLGPDWALQHPRDYMDVLDHTLPKILRVSGVNPADVVGIGLDVTASTAMPCRRDGTPLCFLPEYENNPHAYVKLWKHHAAQEKANIMTEVARARGEWWLDAYGGKVSSEWSLPKLWQVMDEAPEIYAAMDCWVEATDWIVWQLCGVWMQDSCCAGYKCMYDKEHGYPSEEYFAALDERLRHVVSEKLWAPVVPIGTRVGGLTDDMAARFGLTPGIAIATGGIDAHVAVMAAGITRPGQMLAIIGTSTCHMLLDTKRLPVPGICGSVEDGIIPGFWGYESGQSCVGDHYAWMTDRFVPEDYRQAAREKGMNIHAYLTSLAETLAPGESGLIALDWWNGNRSILVDVDLTGMLLGLTLQTRPEEIYRALVEGTAYGMRTVVENYAQHGSVIDEVYALGGISQKNAMIMQIYADVLGVPVRVVNCEQGGALGSAIMGAVAAGAYESFDQAIHAMGAPVLRIYTPDEKNVPVYDALYAEYKLLHDYFGRGGNDVMKRLKKISAAARRDG